LTPLLSLSALLFDLESDSGVDFYVVFKFLEDYMFIQTSKAIKILDSLGLIYQFILSPFLGYLYIGLKDLFQRIYQGMRKYIV
jgi:hypothetical protein